MASSSNESANLMDDFEEAFQLCLLSLTKQEPNTGTNKEEVELEVQKTTNRFIHVARAMEAFFLQKRFLVSTLKPDMLIKDENQDLRIEIQRKEALLNKHYNRLEEWKACLSDLQQSQGGHSRPLPPIDLPSITRPSGGSGMMPMPNMPPGGGGQMGVGPAQLPPAMQTQLQQQKMAQAQQMQQQRMMKMPK